MYLPPVQPVFTSQAVAPCLFILSASMAAYFVGCSMMKAAPKQAEKVAVGSFTPSTVPATCITKTIHSQIQCRGIEETIKRTNWLFISSGISIPQIAYQGSVTADEVIHRLCMRQFADWWQDTKCVTSEQDNILRVWSHARQLDVRDELYRISCPCVLCRTRQKQSITNQ